MYTIAGVTGHVGKAAAQTLLDEGQAIRVIVRDEKKAAAWRAQGAEVAIGDLSDAAFLTKALTGADGAFLLLPPDFPKGEMYERQKEVVRAIAQAVKQSKVPHVVMLSSVGAHLPSGTGPIVGLYHLERALAETGASLTFIRAGSFMENLGNVLGAAKQAGIYPNFLDEKIAQPLIATHDIGHLAARALREARHGTKIYDLVGPKAYTAQEIAKLIGEAIGKPIQLVTIPVAGAQAAMMQSGVPEFMAKAFAEMYRASNDGRLTFDGKGEHKTGATSLQHVLAQLVRGAN